MKKVFKSLCFLFFGLFFLSCHIESKSQTGKIKIDNYNSISTIHSYQEDSILSEPVIFENNDNFVFLDYTIGSIEKCFIQNVTTPFYYDGHIKTVKFTEQNISSKTIESGISNFVSKEKTTSVTKKSTSIKLNFKLNVSLPTETIWTLISPQKLKAKGSFNFDSKQSVEKMTETIVEQSNSYVNTTEYTSKSVLQEHEYDFTGYEVNKYYSIAMVGDVDTHQVFVIDLSNKSIAAVYFYSDIKDNSVALRMVYGDDTNYSISSENQIPYIETIDIDSILSKDKGDGSENNPFIITNSIEFIDIKKNLSAHYKLANSIDLNGAELSGNMGSFEGVLDGDGNSIYNFTVKASNKNATASLFYENNGLIKNLKIGMENKITKFLATGDAHSASPICTFNNGEIINCQVSYCNIETSGKGGGLVYSNCKQGLLYKDSVINCYLKCGKSNDSIIGGIAYNCYSEISNCLSKGNEFLKVADSGVASWFDNDPIHYTIVSVCHNGTNLNYTVSAENFCKCKDCKKKFNVYHVANNEKGTFSHNIKNLATDSILSLKSQDSDFDNQLDYNENPIWIPGSMNTISINFNSLK